MKTRIQDWNPVVRQALLAGYLKKDVENYGLLKLTAAGKRFLKSPESFMIVMDTEFKEEDEDDEPNDGVRQFWIQNSSPC